MSVWFLLLLCTAVLWAQCVVIMAAALQALHAEVHLRWRAYLELKALFLVCLSNERPEGEKLGLAQCLADQSAFEDVLIVKALCAEHSQFESNRPEWNAQLGLQAARLGIDPRPNALWNRVGQARGAYDAAVDAYEQRRCSALAQGVARWFGYKRVYALR
jgi:hypothetical protein